MCYKLCIFAEMGVILESEMMGRDGASLIDIPADFNKSLEFLKAFARCSRNSEVLYLWHFFQYIGFLL